MPIAHRPLRRPDFRCRPNLVLLEDRTTPTALVGLGAASQFAALDINGGDFNLSRSNLVGNVGLGSHGTGDFRQASLGGAVDVDPTAHAHVGAKFIASGGIVKQSLAQAQNDANAASAAYASLDPTQTFRNLTASLTVTGNGGTNVINVNSLSYNHKTLTLSGGSSDVFVFNVKGDFTFQNSQMALTGGVTADHVIFNFPRASSINISNSSNVYGTFLAPRGSLTFAGATAFHGELIAKFLDIQGDQNLTAVGFALPVAAATGSLTGFVYMDFNLNGLRDETNAGLSRVTVTLTGVDAQGKAVSMTTDTAGDGSYTFTGLGAGTYQLTVQLTDYNAGTNGVGTVNGKADGELVGTDTIGNIVLAAGNAGVEYNFAALPALA